MKYDSPRVQAYIEQDVEGARQDSLDLLDEERDVALHRSALYQQQLRRYHSRRVRKCSFRTGDLVLRLIQDRKGLHKLSPPWEGPFIVTKALLNVPTTWPTSATKKKRKGARRRQEGEEPRVKEALTTRSSKQEVLRTLSSYVLPTLSNL